PRATAPGRAIEERCRGVRLFAGAWRPRGRERNGLGSARRHQEVETGVAQRAPAGVGGMGPVGPAFGEAAIVVEEGPAEMLTDSRAQLGAGGGHGVRVDLLADPTRDGRPAPKAPPQR